MVAVRCPWRKPQTMEGGKSGPHRVDWLLTTASSDRRKVPQKRKPLEKVLKIRPRRVCDAVTSKGETVG